MSGKDKKSVNWLTLASSCITRLLFWGSTIYIIYLCAERGYSLTTLHVALFTVGCALLMVEATLVVTGDALLVAKVSKGTRVRLHWILHALGLQAIVIGFGAIVLNKYRNDLPHFTSDHGRVGLAGTIFAFVVGIGAIPTLHKKIVPRAVNFGSFKRTHIYLGIMSLILLWAGQITGFWTGWWRASDLVTNLILSAYVVGGFFLLAKPLYSTLWRSFN